MHTMDMIKPYNNQAAIHTMSQDGVVVCKNIIDSDNLAELTLEVNKIHHQVLAKIKTVQRPLPTYTDIAERQAGRLDYRCGFTADIFSIISAPIIDLINHMSPTIDFRHYWGAIPSHAGSGPTNMHRDVYPITNNLKGEDLSVYDIQLPPYYFTVLIPLVDITHENGPTQFIKGSHRKAIVNMNDEEIYSPLLMPGDVVMFDGRTLHQGAANHTKQERLIAYITFIANWYHDQTFSINRYLFPEWQTR